MGLFRSDLLETGARKRRSVVPGRARIAMRAGTTAKSQWPGRLLVSAGCLFRRRIEQKLAHLAHRIAGDGTFTRPRERLVHIGGFQYPETAHVLLGLGEWPIGDEHRAI